MFFGRKKILTTILIVFIINFAAFPQISPGDLAEVHAHLEGMSNCTQCHTLGEKVSNEKCLACHVELKKQIDLQKGYHSSIEIKGKDCFVCHNDHHGRNFDIIRFDKENFNHSLTGYNLLGAHQKKECADCHKKEFISDRKIKDKKYTYLGLNPACLTCHTDYHQNSLSINCDNCHDFELFKPATKFNHNNTKFQLNGKHQEVDCAKCHKVETRNDKKFQEFAGIEFANCTSCHKDVHQNQFGQDCKKCHTEESFHIIAGLANFDHNKTNFKLEEKHKTVSCKLCHKTKLTDPLKHAKCTDCHSDYHNNQFAKNGISPDCSKCHTVKGFSDFLFTIDQHNESLFKLEGAHLATPCFACHKKEEKWSFKNIGIRCSDCHEDIHQLFINEKYYPEKACLNCHSVESWASINFDHSNTKFKLLGAHKKQNCRSCHFIKENDGVEYQKFEGLPVNCSNCHSDIHFNQFDVDGETNCTNCHEFENWKAPKFDHNNAAFKLDGKHKDVACAKCHKVQESEQKNYVLYKIKNYKCEDCHQ